MKHTTNTKIQETDMYKSAIQEWLLNNPQIIDDKDFELTDAQKETVKKYLSFIPSLDVTQIIDLAFQVLNKELNSYGYIDVLESQQKLDFDCAIPEIIKDTRYLETLKHHTTTYPERSDIEQLLMAVFAKSSKSVTAVDYATAQVFIRGGEKINLNLRA